MFHSAHADLVRACALDPTNEQARLLRVRTETTLSRLQSKDYYDVLGVARFVPVNQHCGVTHGYFLVV